MAEAEKTRYSDAELEEFKQLILKKLETARADYELLRATITHTASNDTEDTSPTFKVLEEGATTLSKEESGRLAAHQMKFIRNLEMALVRIENKTYGICKTTGKLIPKERLMKVPHATECIEAKEGRKPGRKESRDLRDEIVDVPAIVAVAMHKAVVEAVHLLDAERLARSAQAGEQHASA